MFAIGLARITIRLRIALLIIVFVTTIAGLFSIVEARTILAAYTELNRSARPMLNLSERAEQDVRAMTQTLQNLPSLSRKDDLDKMRHNLSDQTERIRSNLAELRQYDISADLIAELDRQLSTAQMSALDAVEVHRLFLQREDRLDLMIGNILRLQAESQRLLEDMAFQITSQTDRIVRAEPVSDGTLSNKDAQLAAQFQTSLNISNIGFTLDSVVTTTTNLRQVSSAANAGRAELLAKEDLQNIIGRLARFPQSPERSELARHLFDLRTVIAGTDGFFSRQREQALLRQDVELNRTQHVPVLAEISDMAINLVTRSLAIFDQASADLKGALQNLIWILVSTLSISIMTILFTNAAIIERQFSRRIKRLTDSVRAIAAGDLAYPVTISGHDELGEMARALRVFRQNAEELRRSNIELEKFAYVAAHDLRSPLRAIHDLSNWVAKDDENTLSAESQAYLALLVQRIERLDRLLRDLLSYARAGGEAPAPEAVDLQPFIRDQMQLADPDGRFEFACSGPDVTIMAELTALQQVLSNLLSNAVRHHDNGAGRIEVHTSVTPSTVVIEVQDDGPGIEPQYQDKVFELFQTLRPRDEVEGSGLGLAIVRKIVDRLDGNITLTSDPAKRRDTTFQITLPKGGVSVEFDKTSGRIAA